MSKPIHTRHDAHARALRAIALLFCAAFWLGLSSCASTEEAEPEPEPTGSEFDQGQMDEPEPEPEMVAAREAMPLKLDTVYFDFDRAAIRDDAKVILQANADQIQGSANGTITIEGHCDERGSEEYNLALGERRANAVKQYLVNLGVDGSQLRTLSYGEAKPAVQGHDESAWRWNRRGAFRSGG
ncbi:MAG: peptidoglycan-associated lipoprotein Pal [Myxococcota bacterium]